MSDAPAARRSDPPQGAVSVAPAAVEPARAGGFGLRHGLLAALVAATLGSLAWHASGRWMKNEALHQTADRWAELRVCLLGDGKAATVDPGQRLRHIRLARPWTRQGAGEEAWPQRCIPYARDFDRAVSTRSMRQQLGELPALEPLLAAGMPTEQAQQLETVIAAIAAADLPAAAHARAVVAAPAPLAPALGEPDLAPFAKPESLADVQADFDAHHGRVLRLLVREGGRVVLCRLNDGPTEERWQTVSCSVSPVKPAPELRLTRAQPKAADLVYRRDEVGNDGFFDAASGLRVWRPRDVHAQAAVKEDGTTTVLYALRENGTGPASEHRIVRLTPGKAPSNKRLPMARNATTLLTADTLLWWQSGDEGGQAGDTVYARPLGDDKRWLGSRTRIGRLPFDTRYLNDCTSGYLQAVLVAADAGDEAHYLLLLREKEMFSKVLDLGVKPPGAALSCHADAAVLWWRHGTRVALERCTIDGCQNATSEPLAPLTHSRAAIIPLRDKLVLAHVAKIGTLNVRVAHPDKLHSAVDTLVFDDARHGGLDVRDMRLISGDGLALLMFATKSGDAHLLRIDASGHATPVRVVR